jgi:hypothetical protein
MYATEHGLAYIAALATIAFIAIGLIVGYDILDNGNVWRDGIVWQMLSIVSGSLTATLHAVGHHQMAGEQEDIQVLIEERVGNALQRAGGNLRAERGYERQ